MSIKVGLVVDSEAELIKLLTVLKHNFGSQLAANIGSDKFCFPATKPIIRPVETKPIKDPVVTVAHKKSERIKVKTRMAKVDPPKRSEAADNFDVKLTAELIGNEVDLSKCPNHAEALVRIMETLNCQQKNLASFFELDKALISKAVNKGIVRKSVREQMFRLIGFPRFPD